VYRPLAMPHHRLSSRSPNASVPRQPRNIIAWRPTDPWACHSGQPPLSAPLSSFSLACRRPGTSSSKQSVIESNRPGIPGWECELARLLLADNDHEVVEQANPLFPSHLASSLAHRRDGVTQGAGSAKGIALLSSPNNCRGGCVKTLAARHQHSHSRALFPPILHDESWSIQRSAATKRGRSFVLWHHVMTEEKMELSWQQAIHQATEPGMAKGKSRTLGQALEEKL